MILTSGQAVQTFTPNRKPTKHKNRLTHYGATTNLVALPMVTWTCVQGKMHEWVCSLRTLTPKQGLERTSLLLCPHKELTSHFVHWGWVLCWWWVAAHKLKQLPYQNIRSVFPLGQCSCSPTLPYTYLVSCKRNHCLCNWKYIISN